jgi:hypothetical protein
MGDAARKMLTREEAAEWLSLSLRQFVRISKTIPAVPIGKRGKRYDMEDLQAWAAERKQLGSSSPAQGRQSSKSSSATPANDTENPRAAEILQRLRSKPRASMPRLFPVGEQRSSKPKRGA